jgi:hypothetical protein
VRRCAAAFYVAPQQKISEHPFRYITKTSFVWSLIAPERIAHILCCFPEASVEGPSQRKGRNMLITRTRAIAAATAAALALTSLAATPASARPYYHHRGVGGAAVLGAVAGLFGTIATIAAREHYERHYGYGAYGPYAAPPPPAPYGYGYGPAPYEPY